MKAVVPGAVEDDDGNDIVGQVPAQAKQVVPRGGQTTAANRISQVHFDMKSLEDMILEIEEVVLRGATGMVEKLAKPTDLDYPFKYKKQMWKGTALHVAVQRAAGRKSVEKLLELKADVNKECRHYDDSKCLDTMQAIHLAVQSGSKDIVEALLNAGAKLNVSTRLDGHDDMTPLHEAAFFRKRKVTKLLLDKKADINLQNVKGNTALHIAARIGSGEVGEILVRSGADLSLADKKGNTALKAAVETGLFPSQKLYLLGQWGIDDIQIVAQYCPSATVSFIRQVEKPVAGGARHMQRSSLKETDGSVAEQWLELFTELMDDAPEAASELLTIFTTEPEVDNVFDYPLPNQACINEPRCDYNQELVWQQQVAEEGGEKSSPPWHDKLAPKGGRRLGLRAAGRQFHAMKEMVNKVVGMFSPEGAEDKSKPVHVRQLQLPGIINLPILHELAETTCLDVFRNPAVYAILEYVWVTIVVRYYNMQLLYRITEMAVMVLWAVFPPRHTQHYSRLGYGGFWDSEWRAKASWSVMFTAACRATLQELWQGSSYIMKLREPAAYISNPFNYLDLVCIVMVDIYVVRAMLVSANEKFDLAGDTVLFSWIILFRWIQLLYTLRGYRLGGIGARGIIPILYSISDTVAIVLVCTFIFCGFWHAFVVLDIINHTAGDSFIGIRNIGVATFRLLFQQDGGGIDVVLNLGGSGPRGIGQVQNTGGSQAGDVTTIPFMVLGQIMFCITVMNIFIAIYTKAYSRASENASLLFLKERAAICLQAMMQPKWPPQRFSRWRIPAGWGKGRVILILTVALSIAAWAGLLTIQQIHPIVSGLFLTFVMILWDAIILQRPWKSEEEAKMSYIWWCSPSSWHEEHDEEQEFRVHVRERFTKLEEKVQELLDSLEVKRQTGTGGKAGPEVSQRVGRPRVDSDAD